MAPSQSSPDVLFASEEIEASFKERTHSMNPHVKAKGASLTGRGEYLSS